MPALKGAGTYHGAALISLFLLAGAASLPYAFQGKGKGSAPPEVRQDVINDALIALLRLL